jgi:hypothetical protein
VHLQCVYARCELDDLANGAHYGGLTFEHQCDQDYTTRCP